MFVWWGRWDYLRGGGFREQRQTDKNKASRLEWWFFVLFTYCKWKQEKSFTPVSTSLFPPLCHHFPTGPAQYTDLAHCNLSWLIQDQFGLPTLPIRLIKRPRPVISYPGHLCSDPDSSVRSKPRSSKFKRRKVVARPNRNVQ